MNAVLATALEIRLAVLFVLGTFAGAAANLAAYRLAPHPRPIGPWGPPHEKVPPRRLSDRLPVVGWWGLRREAAIHGPGFWVRPLLVELLAGAGVAALYWWEVGRWALLPAGVAQPALPGVAAVVHTEYAAHVLLFWLMLVASLIDVDEKVIPDVVTLPGTLAGLALAAAVPWSLLPAFDPLLPAPAANVPAAAWGQLGPADWPLLQVTSPAAWPKLLGGFPEPWSLVIGLGCWWLWSTAILPRTWYARRGWRRAWQLCCARVRRERATYWILAMALAGSAVTAAVWLAGGRNWEGLLSALVGMAAAGGLVWAVRVVGTAALDREAMGFGDVTLMAMIGAFLGWQACLMVFFVAPLAGLAVGLLLVVLVRNQEIPYGPFLCLAAAVVVVRWVSLWDWAWGIFALGWFVPAVVLFCLALMGIMLSAWKALKEAVLRRTGG